MGTTPLQGWPIPDIDDENPEVDNLFEWVEDADSSVFVRFDTFVERQTRWPAPSNGMVCYVAESDETYIYKNQWVSLFPRRFYNTTDVTVPSTSAVDLYVFDLESDSTYAFMGWLHYLVNSADDFVMSFSFTDAVLEGHYYIEFNSDTATVSVGSTELFDGASTARIRPMYGYIYTNDYTTCSIQIAKNADGGADGTLYAYSTFLDVWKVDGFGGIYGYGS